MSKLSKKNRIASQRRNMRIGTPKSSMQMPFGFGSVFDAVESGVLGASEGMTLALHHYWSDWDNDKSFAKSHSNVAKALQLSRSYVRKLRKRLEHWLRKIKVTTRGIIYEISTHYIDPARAFMADLPLDEKGNLLKFSVPVQNGGPFHELLNGRISWRACWMWLVLRLHSVWDRTAGDYGETFAMNYKTLAKKTGMDKGQVVRVIKELIAVGLIERLSLQHEASVFKLRGLLPPRKVHIKGQKDPRRDSEHWYSLNEKWRIVIATGEMQAKDFKTRKWVTVDYAKVPENIRIDLERLGDMSRDYSAKFDGKDNLERLNMKAKEYYDALEDKQHQAAIASAEFSGSTAHKALEGGCNSDTPGCNSDTPGCNEDTLPF